MTTFARTINDKNVVAGSYVTTDGASHAFFGTLDGQYTTFDVLGGHDAALGLNDRDYITGYSSVQTEDCQILGCQFLRATDGTIRTITKDRIPFDGIPEQIVGHQNFVGQYTYLDENSGILYFFGYYGHAARYESDLTLPFDTYRTRPRGFSEDGTVSGWFSDRDQGNKGRGFILKDGVATAYDYPDDSAFITEFEGLNASGQVPGAWLDTDQTFSRAFVFDIAAARFKPLDVPGANYAFAGGINEAGIIAVNDDTSSYIYCPRRKTCPLHAGAIKVPERWIAARANSEARLCKDGCKSPSQLPAARKPTNEAMLRQATARDPELQRELRLPFRP